MAYCRLIFIAISLFFIKDVTEAIDLDIMNSRSFDDPCGMVHPACLCPNSQYRTYDGSCNNLQHSSIGSVGAPFSRTLPARYQDGLSIMFTSIPNGNLPNARNISQNIFKDRDLPDLTNALSVTEYGQLLSHDIARKSDRLDENGNFIKCCTDDGKTLTGLYGAELIQSTAAMHPNCIPIEISADDPFYSKFGIQCISMVRSRIFPQTNCSTPGAIQQVSFITHHLDGSFIYGSSSSANAQLRTMRAGLMKTKQIFGPDGKRRTFLPQVADATQICDVNTTTAPCYMAGDGRVNQNPFLSAYHTLFVREHNRVAKILADIHPEWTDEIIFQETRRIVTAEWQHISYSGWLPKLIGRNILDIWGLKITPKGFGAPYNASVNPSTMNEFTTAAFRFFHSTIQGQLELTGCPFNSSLLLSDFYFRPGILEVKNNLDALLRGSTIQSNQGADKFFTKEITKFLFKSTKPFGNDLESFDVQRERDHGLPSYNDMRKICGLPKAKRFKDFLDVMTQENINNLKKFYASVDDVDLFVGGALEKLGVFNDETATVGPTFGCIIAEQFYRYRTGDRYFYDLKKQAGSFTLAQLNSIKKVSLSSILCDNMDSLRMIQQDAFRKESPQNPRVSCAAIPRLDLTSWASYQPKNSC